LDAILDERDEFPADMDYTRAPILKVARWLINQNSDDPDKKALRPGDNLPISHHVALFNNLWFPIMDAADYLRRCNRKVYDHGKAVQYFERYAAKGILGVHEMMVKNRLR
jgi:hypothetical protein